MGCARMARSFVFAAFAACLAALAGCQSYRIVQTNVFSDEDGNFVYVFYGASDTDHVNTFIAPGTGKEMEFKSRLMVKVSVPEISRVYKRPLQGASSAAGYERETVRLCRKDTFVAWQRMNLICAGTMYETDDKEWIVHSDGLSCSLYLQTEEETKYLEVFRGRLCDSPEMKGVKKDRNVRTLPRQDKKFIGK